MNQTLLNEVKATILNLEIPKSEEEFGGAGLIVTQDPKWTGGDQTVVVLTPYAAEISWLIFQLKEIYDYQVNYMALGEAANEAIQEGKDLRGILTAIVTRAEREWKPKAAKPEWQSSNSPTSNDHHKSFEIQFTMLYPGNLKLVAEILNSEGTILGLYSNGSQSVLSSFLSNHSGNVYYSTTKEKLQEYLNGAITLKDLYMASEDFLVTKVMRKDNSVHFKQDIAETLQCGNELYPDLPRGMKAAFLNQTLDELKP